MCDCATSSLLELLKHKDPPPPLRLVPRFYGRPFRLQSGLRPLVEIHAASNILHPAFIHTKMRVGDEKRASDEHLRLMLSKESCGNISVLEIFFRKLLS